MAPIRRQLALFLASLALSLLPIRALTARTLLVHLHPSLDPRGLHLSPQLSVSDRREKLHESLESVVYDVQQSVASFLQAQRGGVIQILPLWLQNTLVVRFPDDDHELSLFFELDLHWFPGVLQVEEDAAVLRLLGAQQEEDEDEGDAPQSNIKLLHAPQLWAAGAKGKNVVVASIDSGVRYTHEALRDTFRGSRQQCVGWWRGA
jgi:subtilisin family serine protease